MTKALECLGAQIAEEKDACPEFNTSGLCEMDDCTRVSQSSESVKVARVFVKPSSISPTPNEFRISRIIGAGPEDLVIMLWVISFNHFLIAPASLSPENL